MMKAGKIFAAVCDRYQVPVTLVISAWNMPFSQWYNSVQQKSWKI